MPLAGMLVGLLMIAPQVLAAPVAVQGVPTETDTPEGPWIVVPDQVNVRLGPGAYYQQVGILIAGQQAPAVGRSPGGEWIQIIYAGVPGNLAWVYAPLVRLEAGAFTLPVVEPPPTPAPQVTATIDPTLAARFSSLGASVPTRLPTFTPAQPVAIPTFDTQSESRGGWFPPVLAIAGLFVVGLSGTVISVLRRG